MTRRIPLPKGDVATVRLRDALAERPPSRVRRSIPVRSLARLPRSEDAAWFWSERAWSELTAVPAMAQTSLAVVREGGSLDALDALARIASDEVRHTELSRDLAAAFGGYAEEVPEGSGYQPALLAAPRDDSLAFWIVGNGCLSETMSLELMRARLPHTTNPAVRPVLRDVMRDEAMHCRLSWIMAEEVLPFIDHGLKEELADFGKAMLDVLARTFVTRKLTGTERRLARALRTRVTAAGLGAAPPEEEDAVFASVRDTLIRPQLRAFGLKL